jgi:DNA-binding transcriptional LysR family regulator
MDVRQLKIFYEVSKTQSMTKAAKALFISQPAVSQTIQELENEVGFQLFYRQGRSIQLNEAGVAFLEQTKNLLSEFEKVEHFAHFLNHDYPITIGFNSAVANHLVPEILPILQADGYQILIEVDTAGKILNGILNKKIDIALVEGVISEPEITSVPIESDELVIVTSSAHPFSMKESVTIPEFLNEQLVLRDHDSAIRQTLDSFLLLHQTTATPLMTSINTQALLAVIAGNLGVSVLPINVLDNLVNQEQFSFTRFSEGKLVNPLQLIYLTNHPLTDSMKKLISLVNEN